MASAEQILASKPKRENFKTQEEYEEATNYWMNRQGRSPVLRKYYLEQKAKKLKGPSSTSQRIAPRS